MRSGRPVPSPSAQEGVVGTVSRVDPRMTTLVSLSDVSHVSDWMGRARRKLSHALPITSDLGAAAELDRQCVQFIDEFTYLSPDEMERNWNRAYELAEEWQRFALPPKTLSPEVAVLARQDLIYPFEMCLNAATVYRKLLTSHSVEELLVYWVPPRAVIRTGPLPISRAAASLAQAVLRWSARSRRIPERVIRPRSGMSGDGRRQIVEVISRFRRMMSAEVPVSKMQRGAGGSEPGGRPAAGGERVALLLSAGCRQREQEVLQAYFAAEPSWRCLRISPWELGAGGLFETGGDETEVDAEVTRARANLQEGRLRYEGPEPEVFANEFLEFQFVRILEELRSASRVAAAFGSVLDVVCPTIVILGHDAFTREASLVRVAQRRGVPTISLLHGGLGHNMGYRSLAGGAAEKILVWNDDDVRGLLQYGVAKERIRKVGSVGLARPQDQSGAGVHQERTPKVEAVAKRRLGLPTNKPVVVFLTAATHSGFAEIVATPPEHRKTWRQLVDVVAHRPEISFVIKPHPSYDHNEYYRGLTATCPRNLTLLEAAGLDDVLAAADVAVLVNYCTTAALDAMLAGIPVVFVRSAIVPLPNREDSLWRRGALGVSRPGDLVITLEALLESAPKESVADARNFAEELIGQRGGVLSRAGAVFEEVIQAGRARDAQGVHVAGQRWLQGSKRLSRRSGGDAVRRSQCMIKGQTALGLVSAREAWRPGGEGTRFGVAHSVGLSVDDGGNLRKALEDALPRPGAPAAAGRGGEGQFIGNAVLTALIRAIDSGRILTAGRHIALGLRLAPRTLRKRRLFWLQIGKWCMVSSAMIAGAFKSRLFRTAGERTGRSSRSL